MTDENCSTESDKEWDDLIQSIEKGEEYHRDLEELLFYTKTWRAHTPEELAKLNDAYIGRWAKVETPAGMDKLNEHLKTLPGYVDMTPIVTEDGVSYYACPGPYDGDNVFLLFRKIERPGWLSIERYDGKGWVYDPSLVRYLWAYNDNYCPVKPEDVEWIKGKIKTRNAEIDPMSDLSDIL